ncbi:PH domain-containing protein [Lutibacter sp.]|uniref:PH domain-containing protein n=1 Tax=Lutibacter sp. TaxID=1925666 RepID=UPI001A303B80|nr:PH domain-containing protein [Lutibacter sp.]MBI9041740.1 PH domain-containing protein [Lutibacter sp.]
MFENSQITSDLPDIEQLNFLKIHKNYLWILLFNSALVWSVAFIGFYFFVAAKIAESHQKFVNYGYLLLAVVCVVYFVILIAGFSRRKYALREKDISYSSGIIIEKLTTVPFARVQHLEVDQKPFSRLFKLASIQIFTAGESNDDLKINGIPKKEALKIKEYITNFINE